MEVISMETKNRFRLMCIDHCGGQKVDKDRFQWKSLHKKVNWICSMFACASFSLSLLVLFSVAFLVFLTLFVSVYVCAGVCVFKPYPVLYQNERLNEWVNGVRWSWFDNEQRAPWKMNEVRVRVRVRADSTVCGLERRGKSETLFIMCISWVGQCMCRTLCVCGR